MVEGQGMTEIEITVARHWKKGIAVYLPHQCGEWDLNSEDPYTGTLRWVSPHQAVTSLDILITAATEARKEVVARG